MIRSGDMRHLVRLESRSSTQDAAGQQQQSWSVFAERRAAIERSPGNELWSSAQRNGRVPTIFRLRYIDGVSPAMRLVLLTDGSKVFNILSAVDQGGRREELVITAEELVGEIAT